MTDTTLLFIDSKTGVPSIVEPVECDSWDDTSSAELLFATLASIIDAGFDGVSFDVLGKLASGKLVWRILCDKDSPEGRMAMALFEFGQAGCTLLPTDECLRILERIYREQDQTMPVKCHRIRQVGGE